MFPLLQTSRVISTGEPYGWTIRWNVVFQTTRWPISIIVYIFATWFNRTLLTMTQVEPFLGIHYILIWLPMGLTHHSKTSSTEWYTQTAINVGHCRRSHWTLRCTMIYCNHPSTHRKSLEVHSTSNKAHRAVCQGQESSTFCPEQEKENRLTLLDHHAHAKLFRALALNSTWS